MQIIRYVAVSAILLGLTGCGHIATYTDAGLKTGRTGILYYPPKPYLLVARTGAKDKPNDVQVIYLPDLSQPRYADMVAGIGSSKLSLAFSNGVLVSAGQETDPKLVEAITALAGVPGALATASKTRAEADQIREEASDLPKAAGIVSAAAADLRAIASSADVKDFLNPSQIAALSKLPGQLDLAASALQAPETTDAAVGPIVKTLEGVKAQLGAIKPASDDPGEAAKAFWNRVRAAEARLDEAIAELKPKPEAPPTVTLYEVIIDRVKGTSLREVPLSTLPADVRQ